MSKRKELQLQIIQLVEHLNDGCYNQTEGAITFNPFTYLTNGEHWCICFLDQPLVDAELVNAADDIEEITRVMKEEFKTYLESLNKINMDIFDYVEAQVVTPQESLSKLSAEIFAKTE